MFLEHKFVGYCIINIFFFLATAFKQRYLNIFEFVLVPEALLRCRFVFIVKLKKLSRAQLWLNNEQNNNKKWRQELVFLY